MALEMEMKREAAMRKPAVLLIAAVCLVAGCSRSVTDAILDCSAGDDLRHILRIHKDAHSVEDLSFTPSRTGTMKETTSGYELSFTGPPTPGYELRFKINRFSKDGTRELLDPTGKTVVGHGGFDQIVCKSFEDKPLP
jgi:hypothetical protein